LLEQVKEWSRHHGLELLHLRPSQKSLAFYRRLGFSTPTGMLAIEITRMRSFLMNDTRYSMPGGLRFGPLELTVADLPRSLSFYQEILGLEPRPAGEVTLLGLPGEPPLLALSENPHAVPRPRSPGLYHFALLFPSRLELARTFHRLVESRYPLEGAADHLVSEAIYLSDPDGTGIEIYRDRPREEWPIVSGRLQMSNARLDLDALLGELEGQPEAGYYVHPETVMGHLHLRVSDLPQAESFYVDLLGFDLMQHYGSSAAFVSAGGYHHHLGMNTWESVGAPPAPPDSAGLGRFTLRLPTSSDVQALREHLEQRGAAFEEQAGAIQLQDPSGNQVKIESP
jgi:catechol 2,3-dioxygenase